MFSISVSKSQSDLLVTALGLFAAVDVFDVSEVLAASAASSGGKLLYRDQKHKKLLYRDQTPKIVPGSRGPFRWSPE
jgi:hypothetical protein